MLLVIEPEDIHTDSSSPLPIANGIVANEQCLVSADAKCIERILENARVGFVRASFAGEDHFFKTIEDAEVREDRAQASVEIREDAEPVFRREGGEGLLHPGIERPDAGLGESGIDFLKTCVEIQRAMKIMS